MKTTATIPRPADAVRLKVAMSLLQSYDFEVQIQHDTDYETGLMEIMLVSDVPEGEYVSLIVSVGNKHSEALQFYRTGQKHWVNLKHLSGIR